MDRRFPAYKGNDPYVFVCYAHADQDVVNREIRWLQEQHVNLWMAADIDREACSRVLVDNRQTLEDLPVGTVVKETKS